jgi:pyrimidine-specific ribonucleoside hydrolase
VVRNIARVVTMGGSASIGNASAVAEFNVWHDPEAAAIVFGAGLPLTMYGLDVFYSVALARATADELAGSAEPGTALAGRLFRFVSDRYGHDHRIPEPGGAGLGDAGAVCAVIDPDGLTTRPLPVTVALADRLTRGQTVVDHRNVAGEDAAHGMIDARPVVEVALGVDGPRYRDLYLSAVVRR